MTDDATAPRWRILIEHAARFGLTFEEYIAGMAERYGPALAAKMAENGRGDDPAAWSDDDIGAIMSRGPLWKVPTALHMARAARGSG